MEKQNSKKIVLDIDISSTYKKLSSKKWKTISLIFVLSLVFMFLNLCVGSSNNNIFTLISNAMQNTNSEDFLILFNLRLPHVLCSFIAGCILGICGCILQSSLGNPLAAPSTIGVSQGAACGACIAIVGFSSITFGNSILLVLCAFVFALIPTCIIFIISKLHNFSATGIILTGVALSIFFSGLVALVEYFVDSSKVAEIVFWTFGSVHNVDFSKLIFMFIMLLVLFMYSLINSLNLNALECGDTTAHSVGINVKNSRLCHLIFAAIASASVTAFCGTINFIGLIAPHIMRKFIGSNYKYLMPASAFCAASLLSFSDIVSSIIIPGVILPIGAITSIIGAPIFIWILLKRTHS